MHNMVSMPAGLQLHLERAQMPTALKPDAAQQTIQLRKCSLPCHNCNEAEGGRGNHYATLQQHSRTPRLPSERCFTGMYA